MLRKSGQLERAWNKRFNCLPIRRSWQIDTKLNVGPVKETFWNTADVGDLSKESEVVMWVRLMFRRLV